MCLRITFIQIIAIYLMETCGGKISARDLSIPLALRPRFYFSCLKSIPVQYLFRHFTLFYPDLGFLRGQHRGRSFVRRNWSLSLSVAYRDILLLYHCNSSSVRIHLRRTFLGKMLNLNIVWRPVSLPLFANL